MDSELSGMSIIIHATLIVLAICFSLVIATLVWEELARIHNGGAKGFSKKATEAYWAKVKKEMNK